VPRDTIILGKVIGGFACLITPLTFAFLASLTLVAFKGVGFLAEDYYRAGAIFGASVLFLLCLYMLGIMISAATRSAVTSLFVALFVWTILVFNIPPLSHLAAKQLFRAPEYSSVLSSVVSVRQEIQKGFMGKSIQHGMENDAAPSLETIYTFYREEKKEGDDKIRRVLEQHEARLRAQIEGARRLSRISPVAAFANSAMQIGSTGLEEQYDFIGSVRRYQRELFDFINRIEKKNTAINVSNLPRYNYRRSAIGGSLTGAAIDLGILALFTAAFFATSYYLFLRYDIR
jgi:ABC-type transport system involved in multi-copper enzyme maturation permease subunit